MSAVPAAAPHTALAEVSASGAFARSASPLVGRLGSADFPAEGGGRYVLYVSYACPWASRVLAALALKGLEREVAVVVCAPTWRRTRPEGEGEGEGADSHRGWVFRARAAPGSPDAALAEVPEREPLFGAETVREVYERCALPPGAAAVTKFTVPLLVDSRTRRAVCNESSLLLRDLGGALFDACGAARFPGVDLCPPALAAEVEARLRQDPAGFFAQMYGNRPDRWDESLQGADRLRFVVNALTRMRFCRADGTIDLKQKGRPGTQPETLLPWFEVPGRLSRGVRVICGHWSALGFVERPGLLALDSGCVWGDSLTAASLDDGERWQQPSAGYRVPAGGD